MLFPSSVPPLLSQSANQSKGSGPQVTHNLCPICLQIRASHEPFLRFDSFAGAAHGTQGNTFARLVKDVGKDPDEEPDEG